jgi:general secretion pathway protein G
MSAESSFEDEIDGPEKKSKSGCIIASLVSCGVLVILIPLFATLFLPMLVMRLSDAFGAQAKADIIAISEAVTQYELSNEGRSPLSIEELTIRHSNGERYLDSDSPPLDPWGNKYILEPASGSTPVRIWTYGKDGVRGGVGDDLDFNDEMIRNADV